MARNACWVGAALLWAGGCLSADSFSWTDDGGALRLEYGDKPVLQYNQAPVAQPDGVADVFARSAYIHPIWSTAGQVITDDFPSDHYHQRGLFLAWTKTQFGELHPDFWNLGSKTGRIVCTGIDSQSAGADEATLVTLHEWQAYQDEQWTPVLNERWTLRVSAAQGVWVIDLESEQSCATDAPVILPKYHYGGMSYRGAREWLEDPAKCVVLTSAALERAASDGSAAEWCFMGGELGEGFGGATLMDHPDNPRHPNQLRVHPTVPYFGFMLPQGGEYEIGADVPHTFRYRILIHAQMPTAESIDALLGGSETPAPEARPTPGK